MIGAALTVASIGALGAIASPEATFANAPPSSTRAVAARPTLDASNAALKPIVATNPANDFATNTISTLVMTGQDLPVAERDDVGVYTKSFAQVNDTTANWKAGVGTGGWFTATCYVVIGASTATEIVLGVGNMGVTCFKHINAGDQITITLFDASGNAIAGATASGTAVANGGSIPVVSSVTPPYGPETGGNPADTATNAVVVQTSPNTNPEAFWFGGYQIGAGWYGVASTNFTAKGNDQFAVVPPAFNSGKKGAQNYGVAVITADASNGMSNEACTVLIFGCADEYLYMRHSTAGPIDLNPGDLTIAPVTKTFGGAPSPACGLQTGDSAGSITFGTTVSGAASLSAGADVSYSNANIPEAIVGSATVTVTEPIVVQATLDGTISGCVAIPFPPPLAIKNVVGLYFVIGGSISGHIGLTITIAKGTYTFKGGFLPGIGGRADTGGFAKTIVNCQDANGNPTDSCVTTKLDAGINGSLSVTPLWVQLGPSDGPLQANLGVGLTAAGFLGAQVSVPPWPPSPTFSWDLCASVHWVAQLSIPSLKFEKTSTGTFLGPFNIAGDGTKCPLGATTGAASAATGTDTTVAAAPGSAPANGTSPSTVTVTVKDAGGKPVLGKAVTLIQDNGKSSVISAPSGLSDANGVVTFIVTDMTAESVTYTATDTTDNVVIAQTTSVAFTPPPPAGAALAVATSAASTVSAGPGSVPANGLTNSTVTVTLRDGGGAPVAGKTVTLAQDAGKTSVISAASGPSGADGVVTFLVHDAAAQKVTYTATDTSDGVAIIQTTNVTFEPVKVSALESRVVPDLETVTADGVSASTITVTLNDDGGVPVAGKTVVLAQDAGSASVISAASGPSNAQGVVTFTVKDTQLDRVTYTARDVTDNIALVDRAELDFEAGPTSAANSKVQADPTTVAADGSTDSTITVTLKDAFGHPVIDGTVALSADGGHSVISEPDGPSDDNGIVTFSVTDTTTESVTYTAVDTHDNVTIGQHAKVDYVPVTISALDSTVEAGPGSVPNDGETTSTVTVTLLDEGDAPIVGKTVTLAQDAGKSSIISAASGPSDANGVVTFTVTDETAETVFYTATDTTDGVTVTGTDAVEFNEPGTGASGAASTVDAEPGSVTNDGVATSTITVTLRNDFDEPMVGRAVTLTQQTGASSGISAANGLSDDHGVVTFTVSDNTAETVTYTAVDDFDEVAVIQTADVIFGPGPTATEAARSTVKAAPGAVSANGSASSTVTVTLENGTGAPLAGKTVSLAPVSGGSSVISAASGPSDANGVVTFDVTDSVVETVRYAAADVTDNVAVIQTKSVVFTAVTPGESYVPLVPARVVDSRPGGATIDSQASGIGVRDAGSTTELQITGRAGVVANANAVVLNVAVTGPRADGYVTVFPCGSPQPNTSSLNFSAGQTIANAVIAKIDVGGRVCIFTNVATDIVADVNGYFPPGASFAPLVPARLLDSRAGFATIDNQFNGIGVRDAGSVTELLVTGRGGVASNATAVALNVTVTEPQADGFVTAYPCGAARPNTSNLNFSAGETVPNAVIVQIGVGGKVCLYTNAPTQLLADVDGFFLPGSSFKSLVPGRVLDTRDGQTTVDGQANGIGFREAGSTTELQVAGRAGVAADAGAVVLNVTVTAPDDDGFVTVYPCGSPRPNASSLNFAVDQTIPNAVIVQVGTAGKVCLYTNADVDLIADVDGFFPPPPPKVSTTSFNSLVPGRLLDTRAGQSTVDGQSNGLGLRDAGSTTELVVTGRSGVAANATAVALNVTVTEPQAAGFVTAYPCGSDRPTTSNLNFAAGDTIANTVVTRVGAGGKVCLFTNVATHLVVDVTGYFPPAALFDALVPTRLLDSRADQPTVDGQASGIGVRDAGTVTELHVAGRGGVAADAAAAAVVLNITVTEPQSAGFVAAYPCGTTQPGTSSLNFAAGQTIPNAVIVQVGTGGNVCLFTSAATHLIADVGGYFPPGSSFAVVAPARLLDSRSGHSTIDGQSAGIGLRTVDSITELQISGRAGVPANATSVVLNVTVTEPEAAGFVTVYPCGNPRPNTSSLNFSAGQTIPNAVIARIGTNGKVCIYTNADTQLVADVTGAFLP